MDFFEAVKKRRSIRRYTSKLVPEEVMRKALAAAVLAPNSSNTQTWDFYWIKTLDTKKKLISACLDQSAARTAQELLVVAIHPDNYKRSQPQLINYVNTINAPKPVITYYKKLVPLMYKGGIFCLIKNLIFFFTGLFKPTPRGPSSLRDIKEVCIKSAALACENFVLAIAAQGFNTCMMEGFDEWRVKKLLNLKFNSRVVMVISIGEAAEDGTWGPQFRIPLTQVVHEV